MTDRPTLAAALAKTLTLLEQYEFGTVDADGHSICLDCGQRGNFRVNPEFKHGAGCEVDAAIQEARAALSEEEGGDHE